LFQAYNEGHAYNPICEHIWYIYTMTSRHILGISLFKLIYIDSAKCVF